MYGSSVTAIDSEIKHYFMTIKEAAQLVIHSIIYSVMGKYIFWKWWFLFNIVNFLENLISLSYLHHYEDIDIIFTGLKLGKNVRRINFNWLEIL